MVGDDSNSEYWEDNNETYDSGDQEPTTTLEPEPVGLTGLHDAYSPTLEPGDDPTGMPADDQNADQGPPSRPTPMPSQPGTIPSAPPPPASPPPPPADDTTVHVVQPGETLWGISQETWGDGDAYNRIAAANHLPNPDDITPGERLVIPDP